MDMGVSVFFPAYNDAPSLPGLLEKAFKTLESVTSDYEVIVVNDGSGDNTGVVLVELQARYGERLRVVTHEQNRGYGGALRSGFAAATKDLVFYTDGDAQYDPGEVAGLMRLLRPAVGLVNGYKLQRHDPWHRVALGKIYNRVARVMFGIRIRDIDCDFRLIRRELVEDLRLESTSGTICLELVKKIELSGCEVAEVGVHHYPRLHGTSQFFRWHSLLTTLRQFMRLYWQLVVVHGTGRVVERVLCAFHLSA
ncbi:MAG: glycosyltransferase family 2 protein [Acidobacteria bacterium]|nr:glycosyltransferase family 2 protein [Acidobacteriota bacterium]